MDVIKGIQVTGDGKPSEFNKGSPILQVEVLKDEEEAKLEGIRRKNESEFLINLNKELEIGLNEAQEDEKEREKEKEKEKVGGTGNFGTGFGQKGDPILELSFWKDIFAK